MAGGAGSGAGAGTGAGAPPVPYWRLMAHGASGGDRLVLAAAVLGALATGILMPLMIVLFGDLMDGFQGADPQALLDINETYGLGIKVASTVGAQAAKMAYLGCALFVTGFVQQAFWMLNAERCTNRIRVSYLQSLLRQEVGWFDSEGRSTGALLEQLSSNMDRVNKGIGQKAGVVLQQSTVFVAGLCIGFSFGWKLALVILACAPLLGLAGGFMMTMMTGAKKKEGEAYERAGALVEEVVGNMRTVAAFSGEERARSAYVRALHGMKKAAAFAGMTAGVGMGMVLFIMFCSYALALWYGGRLVLEDSQNYTGGTVLIVFFSVLIGAFGLGQAMPNLSSLVDARVAGGAIFQVIDRTPAIDTESEGRELADMKGELELRHVSFAYPSRLDAPIFNNFTLKIPAGATVALVGQSGSGKSTVIQLVERFYDPLSGSVRLDGVDIRRLNLGWYRRQISLVSQEPVLFATSIRENILYGKPNATEKEVLAAAEAANAHGFISKLPAGYDTLCGERGTQLSGGQKQRVAIARAIIKNPKVLLLDEATSALDAESERVVQEALDRLMDGRTTIVVAHRLSTIRNADMIAVMEKGELVETGSHDELLRKKGAYCDLVQLQVDPTSKKKGRLRNIASLLRMESEQDKLFEDVPLGDSDRSPRGSLDSVIGLKVDPAGADMKPGFFTLLSYNRQEWPLLALGAVGCVGAGFVFPFFAICLSNIISVFYIKDPELLNNRISFWGIRFVILAVVSLVSTSIQAFSFAVAGTRLTLRLRELTFGSILRQEIGWFDEEDNNSAAITTRLASDCGHVKGAVGDLLMIVLQNIVTVVFALAIAFYYGWQLALVTLAITPFQALGGYLEMLSYTGTVVDEKNEAASMYASATQIAAEAVSNIRIVSSYVARDNVIERYKQFMRGPARAGVRTAVKAGLGFGYSQFMQLAPWGLVLYIGALFIDKGWIDFNSMLIVFMGLTFGSLGIAQSAAVVPDIGKADGAVKSIFATLKRVPLIDPKPSGKNLSPLTGAIELRDVSFRYPVRPDVSVFEEFSLSVPAGATVALVGQSGSGKSTVIQLVERFYDPLSGSVRLDGVDIRRLNLGWYRRQISLVSQEPVLFATSIRENILYGKPNATEKEVLAAAEAANAHGFISKLPAGYDTLCGERGTQLSGGQKQRVAIARAIIKNPKVLLLDEATSALDAESERVVQEALDRLMDGRTTIVVAHRLSTIRNADVIAVVENGKIVERGSYSGLVGKDGAFAGLVRLQSRA